MKRFKVAAIFLILFPGLAKADGISMLEITERTLSCTDCINWKLIGVCSWLKCRVFPPSCEIRTSPKVGHYTPDLVVAAYSGKIPIDDPIVDILVPDKSSALVQANKPDDTPVDYKDVLVLGNPAITGFNLINQSVGFLCQSTVSFPWQPFFQSAFDPFWTTPTPLEGLFPQAIVGYPYIKAEFPLARWSNVYPRCGWNRHPFDAINGAVAAHRASEIVTRSGQLHLYVPTSESCGEKCWAPPAVEAGDSNTHKWQMLHPVADDNAYVFGGSATWANGRNKGSKDGYVFSLWRPYKCCKKEGQTYLGSVDWDNYP